MSASAREVQIRYGTNAHVKACIYNMMHLMRPVLLKFASRYIDPPPLPQKMSGTAPVWASQGFSFYYAFNFLLPVSNNLLAVINYLIKELFKSLSLYKD